MKLPVVDRIHPQSNTFALGAQNKATGDQKLNEGSASCMEPVTVLLANVST